jgi:hypothetical protein
MLWNSRPIDLLGHCGSVPRGISAVWRMHRSNCDGVTGAANAGYPSPCHHQTPLLHSAYSDEKRSMASSATNSCGRFGLLLEIDVPTEENSFTTNTEDAALVRQLCLRRVGIPSGTSLPRMSISSFRNRFSTRSVAQRSTLSSVFAKRRAQSRVRPVRDGGRRRFDSVQRVLFRDC